LQSHDLDVVGVGLILHVACTFWEDNDGDHDNEVSNSIGCLPINVSKYVHVLFVGMWADVDTCRCMPGHVNMKQDVVEVREYMFPVVLAHVWTCKLFW